MGTDKSKARSLNRLVRRSGRHTPQSTVLIACEGKKTEPIYFAQLGKHLGLHTIQVVQALGTDPMSIVTDAANRKRERARNAERSTIVTEYEQVWCVFDVDEHPALGSAIEKARDNDIRVALSNPCFEYWLLLHYVKFGRTNRSRQQIQSELRRWIRGYEKGADYSALLFERIPNAISHAADILSSQWRVDATDTIRLRECNPSTSVHSLVAYLTAMR